MKLTVLIPVYNTPPHHLLEALYSILNQTDGEKHDVILIDDASNNSLTTKCLDFIVNNYDVRVLFLSKNSGTSVALNEGHKLVKTEYVAIMGSDDVSDLTRFKKQIDFLEQNKDIDVLGTDLFAFYNNDILRKSIFTTSHLAKEPDKVLKTWFINHGTVIYKQQSVMEVGGYDVTKRRAQDVDLWMRMRNAGKYKFANLSEVLYGWRRYPSQA